MNIFKVFESRKMLALTLLGISSGLPLLLSGKTLQAWMTKDGIDLSTIGFFSLVSLPYSTKFLWAPIVDRFKLPFLGRRRGWLLLTQILLVVAIAFMSIQNPTDSLKLLAIDAVAIAFFSATQDIVIDAHRTDVLEQPEMGAGVAVYIIGYRIALLITGSLAFILADIIPWNMVYLVLALVMVLGIVGTLVAPEPPNQTTPSSLVDAVILPFGEFLQRFGVVQSLIVLIFIVLYKLGDAFVGNMSLPFFLKIGFTQTDIGAINGGMGLIATIVGTLTGGALLSGLGIHRSLWIFGGLQAISNLAYFFQAQLGKNYPMMIATINIENFCGGLGTAAFVAYLMSLCNQKFSATQYALLSSFMAFSRDILVAPAGKLAETTGWPSFFIISIVAAIPGLLLLPVCVPWQEKSSNLE